MDFTTNNINKVKKELKEINKNIKVKTIEQGNYKAILPELMLDEKIKLIKVLNIYFFLVRNREIKEFLS